MPKLPTSPTPPSRTSPRILTIYGQPKVGKTTILSKLPNCLILDLEDGTAYLEALKVNIDSYKELREIIQELSLSATAPQYQFVAIDTVSALEPWCEQQATAAYKQSTIGKGFGGDSVLELPMGLGYGKLREEFKFVLNSLAKVTPHLILVAHLRDKFISGTGKDAKTDLGTRSGDIDLMGKIRQIVCSGSDATGYLFRDKNDKKLKLSFETTEELNCGNRIAELAGKIITLNDASDWKQIYPELGGSSI